MAPKRSCQAASTLERLHLVQLSRIVQALTVRARQQAAVRCNKEVSGLLECMKSIQTVLTNVVESHATSEAIANDAHLAS